MALLAAPHKTAFCIDSKDADTLKTKSDAILVALCKIRKAEASSGNNMRLEQLDRKIQALQNNRR